VRYTVTDYILDIVRNAITAGSGLVMVDIIEDADAIKVCVGDNGAGMDNETFGKVRSPFCSDSKNHSARLAELGLPCIEQAALGTEGEFDIVSEEGTGTSVYFMFSKRHIDCPRVGDIPGTVISMMLFDGAYELLFSRSSVKGRYSFSRSEIIETLGCLNDADSINYARRYVSDREEEIA
jgi:hypothetical protein